MRPSIAWTVVVCSFAMKPQNRTMPLSSAENRMASRCRLMRCPSSPQKKLSIAIRNLAADQLNRRKLNKIHDLCWDDLVRQHSYSGHRRDCVFKNKRALDGRADVVALHCALQRQSAQQS